MSILVLYQRITEALATFIDFSQAINILTAFLEVIGLGNPFR